MHAKNLAKPLKRSFNWATLFRRTWVCVNSISFLLFSACFLARHFCDFLRFGAPQGTPKSTQNLKKTTKKRYMFWTPIFIDCLKIFRAFCIIARCRNLDFCWHGQCFLHIRQKSHFSPRGPLEIRFSMLFNTSLEPKTVKNTFQEATQKNVDF